jgi:hypothetical protein
MCLCTDWRQHSALRHSGNALRSKQGINTGRVDNTPPHPQLYSSAAAASAYLKTLTDAELPPERRWQEQEVVVDSSDVAGLDLPLRGTLQFLDLPRLIAHLLGRPDLQDHIYMEADVRLDEGGRRVISDPHNADLWIDLQARLRGVDGMEGACVAAVQVRAGAARTLGASAMAIISDSSSSLSGDCGMPALVRCHCATLAALLALVLDWATTPPPVLALGPPTRSFLSTRRL